MFANGISVLAGHVFLTITIERDAAGHDDVHLHVGGQGIWIGRMIDKLGEPVTVHAALGGESGAVVEGLTRTAGLGLRAIRAGSATPAYVHDRRDGDRRVVASGRSEPLSRHALDDLYEATLAAAVSTRLVVVTGRFEEQGPPLSFYTRLGADLEAVGARVVGDLHGRDLSAFLDGGPVEVLKLSDEELTGAAPGINASPVAIRRDIDRLRERGVAKVVVSSAGSATLAWWDDALYSVDSPRMQPADPRGAGDAMTGALAVALARGLSGPEALALGCGAGAASVTRHGLASADARLVAQLAELVTVRVHGPEGWRVAARGVPPPDLQWGGGLRRMASRPRARPRARWHVRPRRDPGRRPWRAGAPDD